MNILYRLFGLMGIWGLIVIAPGQAQADRLAEIQNAGVVKVGVFADLPRFGTQNANRELEGFDIDLAKKVAEALGVELELVQTTAANRIPYLLTDRVDINIALMSVTPERAKQIMFTSPYVNTALAVYGAAALEVSSAADLTNVRTAVGRGTTEELELTALNPDADLLRTEDNALAVQTYLSGQAQLWAGNSLIALDLMERNPNVEFDRKFIIRNAPGHMGVKMGEHNLLQWLNSFVFFIKANGELNNLHIKWLGQPMDPLDAL